MVNAGSGSVEGADSGTGRVEGSRAGGGSGKGKGTGAGGWLWIWGACVIVLHAGAWVGGFRERELMAGIGEGEAVIESRRLGETRDDLVSKALELQRETRTFFLALWLLGDFGLGALAPALRALAATTLQAGLAALTGRAPGFERGLLENARLQGVWVFGIAAWVVGAFLTRDEHFATSAAVFLPAGAEHSAVVAAGLRRLNPFELFGWFLIAAGGVARGQTGWFGGLALAATLWSLEASGAFAAELTLGSWMRLKLVPS